LYVEFFHGSAPGQEKERTRSSVAAAPSAVGLPEIADRYFDGFGSCRRSEEGEPKPEANH